MAKVLEIRNSRTKSDSNRFQTFFKVRTFQINWVPDAFYLPNSFHFRVFDKDFGLLFPSRLILALGWIRKRVYQIDLPSISFELGDNPLLSNFTY